MTVQANASGIVRGRFQIPAKVSAGTKSVNFKGGGGSHATATFSGQGTLIENVMRQVITQTTTYYDPLAQTFFLGEMRQLTAVEIYIETIGTTPVVIHIRETNNGYPGQGIVAQTTLNPLELTVGKWNRFSFEYPVTLQAGIEYALVVMCNDATASIGIAEMGKWGLESKQWVTSQPANVGVLFSSSNNRAWTAYQDRDMAFRLVCARFTQTSREIELGSVSANEHTDAIILTTADTPASGTGFELELTMPDGNAITAGDNQIISMTSSMVGAIGMKARLTGTAKVAPMLYPGTQIALGQVATTADYVSRAFDADAAGSKVRVTFDAFLPSGSNVQVFVSGSNDMVTWSDWTIVPSAGSAVALGDGLYEYSFYLSTFNKARGRVKLVLSGTPAARPVVMNLRVSVT